MKHYVLELLRRRALLPTIRILLLLLLPFVFVSTLQNSLLFSSRFVLILQGSQSPTLRTFFFFVHFSFSREPRLIYFAELPDKQCNILFLCDRPRVLLCACNFDRFYVSDVRRAQHTIMYDKNISISHIITTIMITFSYTNLFIH